MKEKVELQLKNAEIYQMQENLRRELRDEKDDVNELNEQIKSLELELRKRWKSTRNSSVLNYF